MIERFLYRILGQEDYPYVRPPLCGRKFYFTEDQLIKFNNDGHDVWLGSSDSWDWHCNHREFRRIIAWYLYQWVIIDWFGLRSKIWFFLLSRKIKRNNAVKDKA